MPISRIGSAAAAATTLTLPAGRAICDIELMWVFRNGSTVAPTIPSGWILINSGSGNSCWGGLYYRYCTDAADTSGTFTNATHLICAVYRGVLGVGAAGTPSNATGTSISFPALTVIQSAGNSWIVGVEGHRTASNLNSAAITGMTNVTSIGSGPQSALWDTNAGVSSWSAATQTVNASSGHESLTVELLADNSTWSPYDTTTNMSLSNGNRTVQSTSSPANHNGIRSFIPRKTGKFGFAWQNSAFGQTFGMDFGLCTNAASLAGTPGGGDNLGITMDYSSAGGNAGWINHSNTNGSAIYGGINAGDVGYVVFDLDAGLCWIKSTNITHWNNDPTADPDAGTGGFAYTDIVGSFLYPFFTTGNNGSIFIINTHDISGASLSSFTAWDQTPAPAAKPWAQSILLH